MKINVNGDTVVISNKNARLTMSMTSAKILRNALDRIVEESALLRRENTEHNNKQNTNDGKRTD